MKISSCKTKQQGAALMVMLAIVVVGFAYLLVSRLNLASGFTAVNRDHSAKVLNQAKQALIGYVAQQAAMMNEDNPGRLPCPEGAAFIATADEGIAAPRPGAPTCASVGRLPWRTLGLDKLVDAKSEPLWYVVGPTWRLTNSSSSLVINSNTPGDTVVDGQQVVALIIAPGAAMNVQASAGCTARTQTRSTPAPTMDARDYIECFDAATLQFVTTAPSTSFNDQVVRITTADVLPAIEAAIAHRFERHVAPLVRSAYSGGFWPATPVLPFAAAFSDPQTSGFKGVRTSLAGATTGTYRGLLPFTYSETASVSGVPCTVAAANPRCDPMFVAWQAAPAPTVTRTGGANLDAYNCAVVTVTAAPGPPPTQTTRIDCTLHISGATGTNPSMNFDLQAQASNVGMALRQFNTAVSMPGVDAAPRSATGALITAGAQTGSATITLSAQVPAGGGSVVSNLLCLLDLLDLLNMCYRHNISIPIGLLADHPVIDPDHWFTRNRWQDVAYYDIATGMVPGGGGACVDNVSCLQVTYHPNDGKLRGIIAIAGRGLTLVGQSRPPAAVSDWLEGDNADGLSPYALRQPTLIINRTFNDHFAVIDSNP
jgi:hypothetical protein